MYRSMISSLATVFSSWAMCACVVNTAFAAESALPMVAKQKLGRSECNGLVSLESQPDYMEIYLALK